MARFPDSFVNQVAQATDIVDVVGRHVALKKRGKDFVAVCPFHEDHRPSMYVSPAKQIFKCFACGAGGGVFQFLMKFQKMTFPEAVRHLAERANIPVPQTDVPAGTDRSVSREALLKLTTFAARLYRDCLNAPGGADALAYARGRRLTGESVIRFGLGHAPAGWEHLRSAAAKAGFTDRQLVAAGLVVQRDDGSTYDRLRNRLVFPIMDVNGKVVSFGGRALDPADRAKYLNGPETTLFDKSAVLYALNWSRQDIIAAGQAVVVEGYLDALMCLQAGVPNVVATLGTALTERHVRMLGRYAEEVVLVFDADTAGEAAAERAIETFLTQRLHVRVAAVPAGDDVKDPCDYVLAAGADALKALVAEAPDALEYAWRRRQQQYSQARTLAAKREIVEEFLRLVVSSAAYGAIDALRQGLLAGRLGELVGLSPTDVAEQMRRIAGRRPRAGAAGPERQAVARPAGAAAAERAVLGVLLNRPELFGQVADRLTPAMFSGPLLRAAAEEVWRLAGQGRLDLTALLGAEQADEWSALVTDLHLAAERRGNFERTLEDAAAAMCRRHGRDELESMKAQGDTDEREILRRVAEQARRPDGRRYPGRS